MYRPFLCIFLQLTIVVWHVEGEKNECDRHQHLKHRYKIKHEGVEHCFLVPDDTDQLAAIIQYKDKDGKLMRQFNKQAAETVCKRYKARLPHLTEGTITSFFLDNMRREFPTIINGFHPHMCSRKRYPPYNFPLGLILKDISDKSNIQIQWDNGEMGAVDGEFVHQIEKLLMVSPDKVIKCMERTLARLHIGACSYLEIFVGTDDGGQGSPDYIWTGGTLNKSCEDFKHKYPVILACHYDPTRPVTDKPPIQTTPANPAQADVGIRNGKSTSAKKSTHPSGKNTAAIAADSNAIFIAIVTASYGIAEMRSYG